MSEALQLALFESSPSSSSSDASSSPRSSARTTSSNAKSSSARIDATAGRLTLPAAGSPTRGGADSAASSQPDAKLMVVSAAQRTLPIFTVPKSTAIPELAIPRPRELAQCERGEEARPCPWVSCRHHLLLEVAQAKLRAHGDRRPTTLRLNAIARVRRKNGRRPGLASSAAAAVVLTWIDEAVELLSRLEYTCTFDFVRDHPDGVEAWELADKLGVSEQRIDRETREAYERYVDECRVQGIDPLELYEP